MTPEPDVSEQRMAQIITAATTVFAEKGFDGATMTDIAAEAGINKATIYLYFDSKDALIQSIAERMFAQELTDLRATAEAPGTATERLNAFYESIITDEAGVLYPGGNPPPVYAHQGSPDPGSARRKSPQNEGWAGYGNRRLHAITLEHKLMGNFRRAVVLPLMPIVYEFYAQGLRREDVRVVIANFLNQSAALLAPVIQEGVEMGWRIANGEW